MQGSPSVTDQPSAAQASLWGDLRSPRLMLAKGALFCVLGVLAAAVLLLGRGSIGDAALLAVSVWAFCRAYYFAFYVIEHYADPGYRYAGLWHAARHLLKTRGLRGTDA